MTDHDDILFELTDDILLKLILGYFGKMGCWSRYHWALQKEVAEWTEDQRTEILGSFPDGKELSCEQAQIQLSEEYYSMQGKQANESIEIRKTFGFPLIKGKNEFKVTKGFIDLIVQGKPVSTDHFAIYNSECIHEFIIQIKTENDLRDFGPVLRQIKEYREYYDMPGVSSWESDFTRYYDIVRHYCVLSTSIPKRMQKIFCNENILCMELKDVLPIQLKLQEDSDDL